MSYIINTSITAKYFGKSRLASVIEYIVFHYTANSGTTATAKGNANYFAAGSRQASAHFVVDEKETVYQCVDILKAAYAVGDTQKYPNGGATMKSVITNTNSISIEMVSHSDDAGNYYIPEATMARAVELAKALMKQLGLDENCLYRHYDVTGKLCPKPLIDNAAWQAFKTRFNTTTSNVEEDDEMAVVRYSKLSDIPNEYGFRDVVETLMNAKVVNGDGSDATGNNDVIDLSHDQVRSLVMEYRGGAFDRKLIAMGIEPAVNI